VRRLRKTISGIEADDPPPEASGTAKNAGEIKEIERRYLAALSRNLEYQERYRKNAELLKEKLLWDMLMGRADGETLLRNLQINGIDVRGPRFAVLLVQYPGELRTRHHLKTHFSDEVEQWGGRHSGLHVSVVVQLVDSEHVVLCLQGTSERSFRELAHRLQPQLADRFPFHFHIALGASVTNCAEMYISHRSALQLLDYSRFYPGTCVLHTDSEMGGDELAYYRAEKTVAAIASNLEKGQIAQAKDPISHLFAETTEPLSHEYRQAKITQIANLLLNHVVTNLDPGFFFGNRENPWQLFAGMHSAEDLFAWLDSLLARMDEYYLHRQQQYHTRHVQSAIQYLEERHHEPISVQIVADSVGVSPTYLSTIFKKEIDTSFTQYLLNLRLAAARDLLESTDLPVRTVAEQTGFGSKQTIIRAFKKEYGCTPGAYREQHYRQVQSTTGEAR
jgi:two-component system, response regulator YesN